MASDPGQSMIDNLPAKTGRSLDEWVGILAGTGLEKHSELVNHLKQQHGISHGFANGIVLRYRDQRKPAADDDLVAPQYAGPKAALRPIHDAVVAAATSFGDDVEVAPKRTSVSLRRSKQFAVVEAVSARRVQLGLQLKGDPTTERLLVGNAMCSHKVNLGTAAEVDDEVIGWLRAAYERA
jgi:hypothetical protein